MKLRTGILLALTTALISGVSVYLNKFAVQALPDPFVFTALKNTLVGLTLAIFLAGTWRPVSLSRTRWLGLAALAVVGGSVPFLLFFKGLAEASAPSAALIHKSLFLWVALLAAPLLSEKPGKWTLLGLACLALGQLLNGWPKAWGWGGGETLILMATLLWAVETIVAKRLLPDVPTALAATARMAGGAIVMWLYLIGAGKAGGAFALTADQWGWVGLTSLFLLGYVGTWYAALKRAPATDVTAALTLGAVITTVITIVVEGKPIAATPLIGLALMIAGGLIVVGLRLSGRTNARIAAA